ncbi:hypothetical protein DV736_g1882, partial [Chaetothyriales sp. CBS 134916]
MAGDTRQPDEDKTNELQSLLEERRARNRARRDKEKGQEQKLWEAFGDASNRVNEAPGGRYNSAGGKPQELTWRDAFDYSKLDPKKMPYFWQTGCGRDSILVGIAVGGGAGGLHFIVRGLSSMLLTTNIAVVAFSATSMAMYKWCRDRQQEEAKNMALALNGMRLLNEKKAREKAEAEEAARKAEEERKARPWSSRLKFW